MSLKHSYDENRQLALVGQVRSLLEEYFFSECVQQVIIYDIRNYDGQIFFDCTIGNAVLTAFCLIISCSWTVDRTFYKRSIGRNASIHTQHWFEWFVKTLEPEVCRFQRLQHSGMIMLLKILLVPAVGYNNFLLSFSLHGTRIFPSTGMRTSATHHQ